LPPNGHIIWRHSSIAAGLVVLVACRAAPTGPLEHQAYVWQREWTPAVASAAATATPRLAGLTVLAAEVSLAGSTAPTVIVSYDAAALRSARRPVGLALRIGPFAGAFAADDEVARGLRRLAVRVIEQARAGGIELAELQLDFDCAEDDLDGYRLWVESIRSAIAPVPLAFTALPAWLDREGMGALVRSADGFVLQVHSVSPPARGGDLVLCEPEAARRAVTRAAALGVPFRVALPTYGYLAAFDRAGRILGLTAEGETPEWPEGTTLREVRSDPAAMAGLVGDWSRERPANMTGVIWFRLPCDADRRAWRRPTLDAVLAGGVPRPALTAEVCSRGGGLVEVDLVNAGDADGRIPGRVSVRCSRGGVLAADGLRGFRVGGGELGAIELQTRPERWLAAGERMTIAWLRVVAGTEVNADVELDRS
jgi:hypothetical protein